MAKTVFLDRDRYWQEINSRIGSAKRSKAIAAVAYFAKGGADFLPLRSGDQLVVDMSRRAVQQGVTDPREIKRLIERGVEVFTRTSLHAKVIVIGGIVISGSANVSQNARQYLDEAAILSSSPTTVRAARHFFTAMLSEPVGDQYLEECISLYRPPIFKASRTVRLSKQVIKRAKLWYIAGLSYINPDIDRSQIEALEEEATRELLDRKRNYADPIRIAYRPRWFSRIRQDNWVIDCCHTGKRTREVGPPARLMYKRQYLTTAGKMRHVLMLERAVDGEPMSVTEFVKRWRQIAPRGIQPPIRTHGIVDSALADTVLKFWTPRGKIAK